MEGGKKEKEFCIAFVIIALILKTVSQAQKIIQIINRI